MSNSELSSFVGQWKSKPEIVKCGPTAKTLQQANENSTPLSSSLPSLNNSTSSITSSPTQSRPMSGFLSKLLVPLSPASNQRQRTTSLYIENSTLSNDGQEVNFKSHIRKRSISFTGNSADFYD